MKSDVIDSILNVEDEAQRIVALAKEEAGKIVSDAQAEAAGLLKAASKEERAESEALVAAAQAELDAKLASYDQRSRLVTEKDAEVDPESVRSAAGKIFRAICSTTLGKNGR